MAVASYYASSAIYELRSSTTTTTYTPTRTLTISTITTSTRTLTISTTTTTYTRTRTSSSSSTTSVTSTTSTTTWTSTTRTEAPSELEVAQFGFVDVGVWSLAVLGGYLVVLLAILLMIKLLTSTDSPNRQAAEGAQSLGVPQEQRDAEHAPLPLAAGADTSASDPTASDVTPQVEPARARRPDPVSSEYIESMPLSRRMKRSSRMLAISMLLESGNLISTMIYALEAHQRHTLMSFSVPCGAPRILMPLRSWECPSMTETLALPLCQASLSVNTLCEADAEVQASDSDCRVANQLNNCERYDVYKLEILGSPVVPFTLSFGYAFLL